MTYWEELQEIVR